MSNRSPSVFNDSSDSFEFQDCKPTELPSILKGEDHASHLHQADIDKVHDYITSRMEVGPPLAPRHATSTGCFGTLPNQVRRSHTAKTMRFNLIVTGRSGLGKSTFIRMIFQSESSQDIPLTVSKEYPLKNTQLNMMRYCVEEEDVKADCCVIDTTGFGDYIDNRNAWVPICNYIDKQHMMYMYQEEQPDRSKLIDTRINVCLYFLEPSGRPLSNLDLIAMRKISKRTSLIPVIGKADCFTQEELKNYKKILKDQLDENDIQCYQNCTPFGISCSDKKVDIEGKLRFARTYTYGTINCEDPYVSDFIALRNVLMCQNTLDLMDTTHRVFYGCQRLLLMESRRKKSIPDIETSKIAPIDLLRAIKKVSLQNLNSEINDRDPLFLQQVAEVRSRYTQVGAYQTQQFTEMQKTLHVKQLNGEKELKQLRYDINDLKERITTLKLKQR